jgi:hypothetical protein
MNVIRVLLCRSHSVSVQRGSLPFRSRANLQDEPLRCQLVEAIWRIIRQIGSSALCIVLTALAYKLSWRPTNHLDSE